MRMAKPAGLPPKARRSASATSCLTAQTVTWQKGKDLLVLFTDGIVDIRNPAGTRIGESAILEVVRKHRTKAPQDIVAKVFDRLGQYSGGGTSPDDLTMLVLRS